jgi:hypothetical protein
MLLTKPIQDIAFQDIIEFCAQWPEGIRVEYKDAAVHIPKVISSFANTQGGIWVIGVTADKVTNRAILPIKGFPRETGLEERITQSCYSNLYPPLLPEIRVLDVPNNANNVVAIVRVPESMEAPHAIENTTRVYIRTNSTTERIELAEIDRIDYLLKRRRDAETKGDSISNEMNQRGRLVAPVFVFNIGPQYPYRPVFSHQTLLESVSSLDHFPRIQRYCHPIRNGVMSPSHVMPGAAADKIYFEVNVYGQMTYKQKIELLETGGHRYLTFEHLVVFLHNSVELSSTLLGSSILNLRVRTRLDGISETGLIQNQVLTGSYCLDNSSEAEGLILSERLRDQALRLELMVDLVVQLLWPYNWGGHREAVKSDITRALPRR